MTTFSVTQEQVNRLGALLQQLYQQDYTIQATQSIEDLVDALENVRQAFSGVGNCPLSSQLIDDILNCFHPMRRVGATLTPAFESATQQFRRERGERMYQRMDQSMARPSLRRSKSD